MRSEGSTLIEFMTLCAGDRAASQEIRSMTYLVVYVLTNDFDKYP
jgi:hypothetical protein